MTINKFIISALYDTCTLDHIDTIKKSIDNVDFDDYDSIRKNLSDAEIDDIAYAVMRYYPHYGGNDIDEYAVDQIVSVLSDVRIPTILWDEDEEIIVTDNVAVPF